MPGYRAYDDPAARAELAELWGVSPDDLPTERGRAYPDIINAVDEPDASRALWIIGTNPLVSFPNREVLEHALRRLELLVVQDGFETPTTALADVVLPAAIWGEKEGTFTNSERRVSRVRAAVAPPGEARPDFDIFLGLAEHLGHARPPLPGLERARATRSRSGGGCRPAASATTAASPTTASTPPAACSGRAPADDPTVPLGGSPRLYADGGFPNPTGKVRLHVRGPPGAAATSPGRSSRSCSTPVARSSTGTPAPRPRRVPLLERLAPEAWVEINDGRRRPRSGSAPATSSGSSSSRGAIDRIVARVTPIVRAGEVFIPFHYDEACANRLTLDEFDPISREPNYKQCAVRIDAWSSRSTRLSGDVEHVGDLARRPGRAGRRPPRPTTCSVSPVSSSMQLVGRAAGQAEGAEVEAHGGLVRLVRDRGSRRTRSRSRVDVAAAVHEERAVVVAVVEADVAQRPHARVGAPDLVAPAR